MGRRWVMLFNSFSDRFRLEAHGGSNRVLTLYTRARSLTETVDHVHQYTRCLEGLTVPPIQGTRRVFAERSTLFTGATHRGLFENLYAIRGEIEHLHEYRYLEVFDRSKRIDLLKKAGISEYVARSCLSRFLISLLCGRISGPRRRSRHSGPCRRQIACVCGDRRSIPSMAWPVSTRRSSGIEKILVVRDRQNQSSEGKATHLRLTLVKLHADRCIRQFL